MGQGCKDRGHQAAVRQLQRAGYSVTSVPRNRGAWLRACNVRFFNRPFRVKRFQAIHHYSVDVAHGHEVTEQLKSMLPCRSMAKAAPPEFERDPVAESKP